MSTGPLLSITPLGDETTTVGPKSLGSRPVRWGTLGRTVSASRAAEAGVENMSRAMGGGRAGYLRGGWHLTVGERRLRPSKSPDDVKV